MKVVGITIGPIGETLSLAKTPAMLWYASAVFSNLSFILCKNITEKINDAKILVPYISDHTTFAKDGIGKYHDRVIFKAENIDNLESVIDDSKSEIASIINIDKNNKENADDKNFLLNYIQVKYCIINESDIQDNIILAISDQLTALEQMRTFNPDNTNNTFAKLFNNENFRNSAIGNCKMLFDAKNSQLLNKDCFFRKIEDIAMVAMPSKSASETVDNDKDISDKPYDYYAVIQADGDKIGEYLSSLANDKINEFSKNCINYAKSVAQIVGDYGGMTIYAGGDDLLAIAPVLGKENKNIFDLCIEIGKCFDDIVKKQNNFPTVSIGVSIRHTKFPLYEALNSAGTALFGKAKTGEKNNTCIDFQKHSGQSVKLLIPSEKLGFVSNLMKSGDSETVNSIIYILDEFKGLIEAGQAMIETGQSTIKNIFKNLYDNSSQQQYVDYIEFLAERFTDIISPTSDRKITVYDCKSISDVKTFEGLLRIKKFMTQEVRRNV